MKTIKKIQLLLFVILFSCSKNDDSPAVQGYFPTQIQKTDYNDPNRNRTFTIAYNPQNQISKIIEISLSGESATSIFSYAGERLTKITTTVNNTQTITRDFIYNPSNRLSSIIKTDSDGSSTFTIVYNASNNSYTINDSGSISTIYIDENNNPLYFEITPTVNFIITTDNQELGVFKNVKNQIGMQLAYGVVEGINFSFFHNKQINQITYGATAYTVENAKDSENNIRTINYLNATTSSAIYGYIITYEKRNL